MQTRTLSEGSQMVKNALDRLLLRSGQGFFSARFLIVSSCRGSGSPTGIRCFRFLSHGSKLRTTGARCSMRRTLILRALRSVFIGVNGNCRSKGSMGSMNSISGFQATC